MTFTSMPAIAAAFDSEAPIWFAVSHPDLNPFL
jgi:hypothetical protein